MKRGGVPPGDETELATRAAWLYYEASLTQAEISEHLRIPPARVQRLIAGAARDGLVRILIEGDLAGCLGLERRLIERFSLTYCRVVPSLSDEATGTRRIIPSLGRAAAAFLHEALSRGGHSVVGLGHGRTMAAMIDRLPREMRGGLKVASIIGGLSRRTDASLFDVIHALADKTGAAAYLPPVPFYAQSRADRRVLLRQRGVAEAFDVAAEATLYLMGIGEIGQTASLSQTGMVLPEELDQASRDGAVAEMLGLFVDARGTQIRTELHDRRIGIPLPVPEGREVLAVAGGPEKRTAITAILRGRLITGLITDETTAQDVLEAADEQDPAQGISHVPGKRRAP